jgi:hypothetical protein
MLVSAFQKAKVVGLEAARLGTSGEGVRQFVTRYGPLIERGHDCASPCEQRRRSYGIRRATFAMHCGCSSLTDSPPACVLASAASVASSSLPVRAAFPIAAAMQNSVRMLTNAFLTAANEA